MTPSLLTNLMVGRRPTRLHAEAGERMELMVSVPCPLAQSWQRFLHPFLHWSPLEFWLDHRVDAGTKNGANGFSPYGELMEVHLGKDDGTRLL